MVVPDPPRLEKAAVANFGRDVGLGERSADESESPLRAATDLTKQATASQGDGSAGTGGAGGGEDDGGDENGGGSGGEIYFNDEG
jgi:hypothetical protein